MAIVGLIIAVALFWHFQKRLHHYRREYDLEDETGSTGACGPRARSWHEEWERHWADKFRLEAERRQRDWEQHSKKYARHWERQARRWDRKRSRMERKFRPWWAPGTDATAAPAEGEARVNGNSPSPAGDERMHGAGGAVDGQTARGGTASAGESGRTGDSGRAADAGGTRRAADAGRGSDPERGAAAGGPARAPSAAAADPDPSGRDAQILRRARKRARAETGFYAHLMSYLGVMAFLALINLFTARYPWFLWPATGWGIGLFAHWMAVFGSRTLRERYFDPAVEREVRRETMAVRTEKQASIDELSATIAHEIRNPIAAAKSLVQQMGEDPRSVENVEYAEVALEELDRVERSISHLLRYAKEEDLHFSPVNLASVVDSALTEMKAKLDAAKVSISRNYIAGPTIIADGEKLRQVFANVLDNAIDALQPVAEDRRVELFIENGVPNRAKIRVRDNGAGIAADKIDRIFNPFFTTKEKGTGLGMAISKKIVEAHEGTIDVVSEPARGTEFVITLPLPH